MSNKKIFSFLPNILTITRILMIPLVVVCILLNTHMGNIIGMILFIIASITDFLDGYIARIWKVTSRLGELLDPIADKLLVLSIIFILTSLGRIDELHLIPAIIILCREIFISGLREFLSGEKISIPVIPLAKVKTTLQLISISALIVYDTIPFNIAIFIGI